MTIACEGERLDDQGKYEEAKVFYLAALEGQRRVLGEEHKKTLPSLNSMGILLKKMEDYEGALGYYQQAGSQAIGLGVFPISGCLVRNGNGELSR